MDKVADRFSKWACLQVSHLSVLDDLSATFCSPATPQPPKISLLAVKYPHLEMELKVELWRNTLWDLLANDLNADNVINTISGHIDATKKKGNMNPICKMFRMGSNPITFRGNIHCQALLASHIKYAKDKVFRPMAGNSFLRALLPVMFYLLHCDPH